MAKAKRKMYRVLTWDMDLQKFTPQKGVNPGPHTLAGVRKALQQLRELGYSATEDDFAESDPSVAVDVVYV